MECTKEESTGGWGDLHNKELSSSYSSFSIRVTSLKSLSLGARVAYTWIVSSHKMLTGKTERYRSLGSCSYRWEGMVTGASSHYCYCYYHYYFTVFWLVFKSCGLLTKHFLFIILP